MSNQSPRLDTVMRRAIRSWMRGVRVSLPGRVESYDPATGQASVQPLVQDAATDETGTRRPERLPVVTNVPCIMMQGGSSRLTFPIAVGDECLLIFASSAVDRWITFGGEVDPKDGRHHHLTDAFALVGISSEPSATPAHATATVLEGDDIRLGDQDATDPVLRRSDLQTIINLFNAHVHNVATTGTAVAQTGVAAATLTSMSLPAGSSKVSA